MDKLKPHEYDIAHEKKKDNRARERERERERDEY